MAERGLGQKHFGEARFRGSREGLERAGVHARAPPVAVAASVIAEVWLRPESENPAAPTRRETIGH